MEEPGPSTSNNVETPESTASQPASKTIIDDDFIKSLRFPAIQTKEKNVLHLCREEDEKWAKKVGWKKLFPEELQDHSYCYPGQTEKYKSSPDELPEPETKDMDPIYAEDEVRKPNNHIQDEEPTTSRLFAVNGEILETGHATPQGQRPVISQGIRSISPTKPMSTSRIPILPRPEPPHRMTPVGQDLRIPIQTGRAPLIVPARGRTVSRSQDVILPDNHMALQRKSMSPMKTNETGVPLPPDRVTRTLSPHKVRIIRQNPERPPHLASRQAPVIIPQSSIRARALEREEVLPPHIAATALDLLSEHGTAAAAVDPTDPYKVDKETMKMEIDNIRRNLQKDISETGDLNQPRLQSPPMRRFTSPPQGGRQRNMSTSSNSSVPGPVRTGALIRHPGSPPLKAPMDGVRVQSAVGTPPMRNGVKSNLKKTATVQQPVDSAEPSRRSSRARNSTSKKAGQEEGEEKMRCLCGVTTDIPKDEPWVSCDRCGVWQHQYCAGFKSRKGANYLCDECEDPANRRKRPSEQEAIAYINAKLGEKDSDDEDEEEMDTSPTGAERKHQTRRETATTTPVRGTVTKNVRSLLTVAGTGNNFTGPKSLSSCAKMNVANDHTPGIVAQSKIAPGTAVIEIVANLCIPADIDKPKSYNPHIFYYDGLVDQKTALTTSQRQENQICLDARKFALDGKFVRRCCRPNSTIKHIYASNQVNFYVVTRQQINVQDEITVPFEAGFKPTRRDQCRCIPDTGCLLDTGSFIGPGFCDLPLVRSPPPNSPPKTPVRQAAASPTRRFVSPPRPPVQAEVAIEEVKAREEKSEEETPAPRSTRRGRTQSTSKKASETEEVKAEEPKEEPTEGVKETLKNEPIEKKKSPVKQETPKRAAAKRKPSFPKSELDGLLALQNNVNFDVDFKQKESREQRKARELFERMEKENARKAALDQAKNKKKTPATKTGQKTSKVTPNTAKNETEQKATPSRRTRSQAEDAPTTSKVEAKEEEAEPAPEMEKSPSSSKNMSAPKKMFQHRYNQEKAAEPEEPVNKRSRRSGGEVKIEASSFDFSKELEASLKILEKKLKQEDYNLPEDCLKYVPKRTEPAAKRAKAVPKRKAPKEIVKEVELVPKKGKAAEVKEEKDVPERPRRKSESKAKAVEEKKDEPKVEETKIEEENKKEPEAVSVEEPVPEPAPVTERPRRSINLEEYKRRRAEQPAEEEPSEPKRKSFMPDFSNVPQTVTLPDLPLGFIDQKQLEREILGLPSTGAPSFSTRQSHRNSLSAPQPSSSTTMSSPPERKERGQLRDRLAQLFNQDSMLARQPSTSNPSDPRVRRSNQHFTE